MNRRIWLLLATASLLIVTVIAIVGAARASAPTGIPAQAGKDQLKPGQNGDGFDQLPANFKALSYSTLVNTGKVHPSEGAYHGPVIQVPPPAAPQPATGVTA